MNATTRLQRAFSRLASSLERAGLGRLPFARLVYGFLHRLVFPGGERRIAVNGMPLWIDTRDRVIATHLVGDEIWEATETAAFLAHTRPGMCVLDVGANIGYYTLLAARAVGPSGLVCAFEPEPHNFALLSRSVAENGFANVRLVQAAVSDREGATKLHLDDANFGAHSFDAGSVPTSSGRSVDVRTVRLDDYEPEVRGFAAGVLVKVDVQGAEGLVVAGGRRLLGLPGVKVLLEIWPDALERAGADAGRLLAELEGLGFRFEDVEAPAERRRALVPPEILAECRARPKPWMNLLLTKTTGP